MSLADAWMSRWKEPVSTLKDPVDITIKANEVKILDHNDEPLAIHSMQTKRWKLNSDSSPWMPGDGGCDFTINRFDDEPAHVREVFSYDRNDPDAIGQAPGFDWRGDKGWRPLMNADFERYSPESVPLGEREFVLRYIRTKSGEKERFLGEVAPVCGIGLPRLLNVRPAFVTQLVMLKPGRRAAVFFHEYHVIIERTK